MNLLVQVQKNLSRCPNSVISLKTYKQYPYCLTKWELCYRYQHSISYSFHRTYFSSFNNKRRCRYSADENIASLPKTCLNINYRTVNSLRKNIMPLSLACSYTQVRHVSGESYEYLNPWTRVFLWMSESIPVSYAQDFLLFMHNSTGLPWWTTIVLTTVLLRSVMTLPLAVYQNYILAKVENLQLLEMPELVKELKKETAIAIKKFNWSEKQARVIYNRSLKKQWNDLVIRDNCHPFKASLLVWVQLPMWIFLSVALRNLVYMLPHSDGAAMVTYLELSVGGFGWIPNLLVPDESLVLPVALGLINLAIVECLNLYWVTSSTYGLMQNLVLLSPRVKKLSHIPETPSQLENPYQHIASVIRERAARIPFWRKTDTKN
ncbi:cytochrome c oxidase assembly protein COX18, mitochondrial isoform X2 [Periplaneta americana]|uniref:cytochrome c oxidase assembly protein COX18, mitochondrial isoform X2 n=1 Tax=Periplaneta americana TaxID=6978 RepID=UPI0037E8BE40